MESPINEYKNVNKYIGEALQAAADAHFGLIGPHQWSVLERT